MALPAPHKEKGRGKTSRLLSMFERLNKGDMLAKASLSKEFAVDPKTVQRDIDDIRAYLAEEHQMEDEVAVKYSREKNAYYLLRLEREWLTNEEILALAKILLESRAFCKEELKTLLDKLLTQVPPANRKTLANLISSERANYVPLRHGKKLFAILWELAQYIGKSEVVSFGYTRQDGTKKLCLAQPVAIMFSEFYFYLIAFYDDASKDYPIVFRVDRIDNLSGAKRKFTIPYHKKFSDGEFRKRVQFMYPGKLRKMRFTYTGPSVDAILDRLPTAKVLSQKSGAYEIEAEVYGTGIDMWLKGQGDVRANI
jgi:predicted DNA-binding transcriptional regulator YafY